MKILMVTAELAPLAKTGGLGDAVAGLSRALVARGHDVRVLLPRYAHLPPSATAAGTRAAAGTAGSAVATSAGGSAARVADNWLPPVHFVDLGDVTGHAVYLGDERDGLRFLRLAEAAVDFAGDTGWRPDVLHCHDWHAALAPVLARAGETGAAGAAGAGDATGGDAGGRRAPTVLTLHNIGYQGVFGEALLGLSRHPGLNAAFPAEARADGAVNFLRAGVQGADALTTVSPTYAREIRTPAFGMGLESLIEARSADLTGILNGVDYDTWGPDSDPFLGVHYDAANPAPKYQVKGALCARLKLVPDQNAPLLGVVSRLAPQKGIDLITAVMPTLLRETRASFAVLGSGNEHLAAELGRLAAEYPRRVSFTHGYDEGLAHQILAGSDIALVPSRYEPCGLTQMYALRYGTIPVVRATGGLADTIQHFDIGTGGGNGASFRDADPAGLLWGIRSALGWFDDPQVWSRLMANAMRADFSWARQVRHYEAVYRRVAAAA